ncbi:ABC transporter ATP-binding protein [Paradevosia shaoguanensis]|uniref:ATP-binding cassette domain-containing protein n=1 Tax=Paradevosia shaoguanensis TaxID=1335043 RepID=A0AA41QPF0_9HYPH|nr:oligopeptide/dipeptide ABC transporter ATP-binding protein [Paradevosia shaoguanensis]MCF1743439.1 ATP-binding cassette domain-containing protein [Paradevosia shaoguanensis]MCI0127922.1 ATP-binding cassette domain-containing protein [Paradevosia shaoguanensis]QMV01242.1 ATP-binding cassette domain-containing protein [Devosia sp. D6-9]
MNEVISPAGGAEPLLSLRNLKTYFGGDSGFLRAKAGTVRAVDDVSFDIARGEVVGLVGESGSGKTTIGRSILRLVKPTSGSIFFEGVDIAPLEDAAFQSYRRKMQFIFQDPYASLDPRKSVGAIITEALAIHRLGTRSERQQRVAQLLEQVGLGADAMKRYPHEFSGGQRQRIGIARALAVDPQFIVADEPVSALDVSVQAQIVNLIQDLQTSLGLTVLFVAHDLAVVEHLCDRVIVMYLGKVMEVAPKAALYSRPRHPYTKALLSAIPRVDPTRKKERIILDGDIPSPINPPSGCVFRTRCSHAIAACSEVVPEAISVGEGHTAACIRTDIM